MRQLFVKKRNAQDIVTERTGRKRRGNRTAVPIGVRWVMIRKKILFWEIPTDRCVKRKCRYRRLEIHQSHQGGGSGEQRSC